MALSNWFLLSVDQCKQQSVQQHGKFLRCSAKLREEFSLQLLDGEAMCVRPNVQCRHYFSAWILDGNRHGTQTNFKFLIDERVAVTQDEAQRLP